MVDGSSIPKAMGECDTAALDRNLKMGQRYKVNGTPAVVFEDGSRSPGALPAAQIEARFSAAKKG
jgi:thiol:disulfide interchange protein DsbC